MKLFDEILRRKFPNLKSIYVSQNYGGDNLTSSHCELIIMDTISTYEIDNYKINSTNN